MTNKAHSPFLHPGVEVVYTRVDKACTPGWIACLHPGGGGHNKLHADREMLYFECAAVRRLRR